MKKLLIGFSLGLIVFAYAGIAAADGGDELRIGVALTTGEHSRDSSSETETISVTGNLIVWQKTFGGRRRGTPAQRKEFSLSPDDKRDLVKLIRSNKLLVTDSIELPRPGSNFRYFEISLELTLDGKTGKIDIGGPRTALKIKEEKLYQDTQALVKELYRIIGRQDKSVLFDELVG
jgi:hypothetical protein